MQKQGHVLPSTISRDSGKYDHLAKVVLLGDTGVGKSCLLLRFAEDTFTNSFISTIGIDFKVKTVNVDGVRTKLQIYDTAGQERFRTITAAYYRGAQGVMLVYDVTDARSFGNIRTWVNGMTEEAENACKILVANKCDLEEQRVISTAAGEKLADEYGFSFIEVSAKNKVNVDESFTQLVRDIKKLRDSQTPASEHSTVKLHHSDTSQKKGCKC